MLLPSVLLSAPVVSGLPSGLASSAEGEGNPWWLWIIVFVILAAFAAFVLWWWLRSPAEEEEVPRTPARSAPAAPAVHSVAEVSPEIAGTPEPEPEPVLVAPEPPRVDEPEIVEGLAARSAAIPALEPEPEPVLVEPEPLRADDLKIVEGIGPKISAILGEAGITTFAQLARLDAGRLRQILHDRNPNLLRLADPETWPEQARLAADGEWEALDRFQRELRGGRRT